MSNLHNLVGTPQLRVTWAFCLWFPWSSSTCSESLGTSTGTVETHGSLHRLRLHLNCAARSVQFSHRSSPFYKSFHGILSITNDKLLRASFERTTGSDFNPKQGYGCFDWLQLRRDDRMRPVGWRSSRGRLCLGVRSPRVPQGSDDDGHKHLPTIPLPSLLSCKQTV